MARNQEENSGFAKVEKDTGTVGTRKKDIEEIQILGSERRQGIFFI